MKVLMFTHPESDYYAIQIYSGLWKLIGPENIYMMEYKNSFWETFSYPCIYHEHSDNLGTWQTQSITPKDKRVKHWGHTGKCEWQDYLPGVKYATDDIIEMIRNDEFNLFILESGRKHAQAALNYAIEKVGRDKLNPLIIFDGEDSSDKMDWNSRMVPMLNKYKPFLYFKREYTPNGPASKHPDIIIPCPMSSCIYEQERTLSLLKSEKSLDVFFGLGATHPSRQKLTDLVLNTLGNKYKIIGKYCGWKQYTENIARAKISIDVRGHGFTTLKHYELSAFNTLMFRMEQSADTIIPNDWTNGINVINYKKDLSNLIELLDYYLSKPTEELIEMGKKTRKHLLKYHTENKRVEYIIRCVNDKLRNLNYPTINMETSK